MDNHSAAIQVTKTLRDAGHEAYLVGGCVRDRLLGRKRIKEHDVATSARPEQIRPLFSRSRLVGAKFGVVLVGIGRHWIEVASFRTDGRYSDGRHPDHVEFATIEEDAQRRDFTINGMYHDPFDDRIIDLVGGMKDLEAKRIRAIGNPGQRFLEDYLRMLRAVRFAAQLDFDVEPNTAQAIAEHAEHIRQISPERILEELKKLLIQPARASGIRLAAELNLLDAILPEVAHLRGRGGISLADPSGRCRGTDDAFEQTVATLSHLGHTRRFAPAMVGLLHLVGLGTAGTLDCRCPVRSRVNMDTANASATLANTICRRLTCSNRERLDVVWLVQFLPLLGKPDLTPAELRRIMLYDRYEDLHTLYSARVKAGLEPSESLTVVDRLAGQVLENGVECKPLITGADLSEELHLPHGPAYRQILDEVFDAQLNEEIHTRQEALDRARLSAKRIGSISDPSP